MEGVRWPSDRQTCLGVGHNGESLTELLLKQGGKCVGQASGGAKAAAKDRRATHVGVPSCHSPFS
jgi:hypothetical protein